MMAKPKILPSGPSWRSAARNPQTNARLTPYAVARACSVPRTRIERLAREETLITADTALRLARYFRYDARVLMGIQAHRVRACARWINSAALIRPGHPGAKLRI